ncbi:outer membrane beta-barrel protein [Duganella sp. Root336D2]|uniref:outer membrane beta-barrel protein n=1 Tax=Duganella sp. Root336D2 TaxID=1736518 RepID=UPI0006F58392|nr:outer membrane beta-barrel protein [Duganella sp. Root336D2]KQV55394.1 hypothetical protein ASD07_28040 [Duganella sp. Root336D2]
MKRLISIIALCCAGSASAQDYFAGVAVIAPGDSHLDTQAGRIKGSNDPLRFKLYGGINLSDSFALEAGYARFGKDRFAATGVKAGISTDILYLAARGTWHLGDSFELFGRAGIAAQRYRIDGLAGTADSKSGFAPLLGVGLGYKLSDTLTLTVEAEHFGRVEIGNKNRHFGRGAYSAGLKYSF